MGHLGEGEAGEVVFEPPRHKGTKVVGVSRAGRNGERLVETKLKVLLLGNVLGRAKWGLLLNRALGLRWKRLGWLARFCVFPWCLGALVVKIAFPQRVAWQQTMLMRGYSRMREFSNVRG